MAKVTLQPSETPLPSKEECQRPHTPDGPCSDSRTLRNGRHTAAGSTQTCDSGMYWPLFISDTNRRLYVAGVLQASAERTIAFSMSASHPHAHALCLGFASLKLCELRE